MCPQRFIKKLQAGFEEITPPKDFKFLISVSNGFVMASGILQREMRWKKYTPDDNVAVRLPDGRLVIPTVHNKKEV